MGRNRWLILLLVVLIAAVALWFAKPFENRRQSLEYSNVNELVKASQAKVSNIKNYHYKTTIEVGDQIRVSLSNSVDLAIPKRQMINFSWSAPNMSGMAAMYVKGEDIYIYNPLKDKWELPTEEQAAKPMLDFFWKQIKLVDPLENLLRTNGDSKNITEFKTEETNNPAVVMIEVIPDAAALSEISKALPPQFAGAELQNIRQIFWISKNDLLISKYELHAKVSFFGVKTMNFKTVSTPSDYDKTEIKLPERLTDKIKLQGKTP